ncbi:cell division protein SepF [Sporolactobacillus vineae]|uniref:cell division protein SepF n=1 Tax=Sporolactobacillus vineae TaxID=444463 RepID=UPI000287DC7E|nr:cell division protein SepF [Sporolactobacillus vineae]
MGLKSAFRRFFDLEETIDPEEEELLQHNGTEGIKPPKATHREPEKSGHLVAIQNIRQQEKVVLVEPKVFDDVEDIVTQIKNKKTVICSLDSTTRGDAQRILDFMSGTCFALNGQLRKIGKNTFLFAPDSVSISGMINSWRENTRLGGLQ